ncbi:MAG: acetate--CoA ligase alpha subunit [Nitrospirota bacterium]
MLDSFFTPKSIAVIGASRTPGKVGFDILRNLVQYDYQGRLYPVNPSADEILGKKTYRSLADVPDTIDLAVIVVPAKNVLSVIEECGKKKTGAAVIISAGFKESGVEGAKLEHELVSRAAEAGVRFIGPNCLGIIDTHAHMNASFAAGMPAQGGIGFFSQSGALCLAVLDRALPENIGFSKFISMGNKADITDTDIMSALAEDENTRVILGYIEGVSDGRKFMEVASEVSKKKPLIILKSGITSSGAKAASSHTGALAGREATFDAAFRQSGVIRAHTINDLFNYALAFASQPLPKGPHIAIVTNSGGPGILAADACDKADLQLVTLHKETVDKLREFLPSVASFYNPIDILGDSGAERYEKTLRLVLQDSSIQGVLVLLTPTAVVDVANTARKVSYVAQFFDKPVLTSFMGKKSIEPASRILMQNSIPNYEYPEEAVASYHALYRYHTWIKKPPKTFSDLNVPKNGVSAVFGKAKQEGRDRLTDEEVHEVLKTYGFRQPKGLFARTSEEAVAAARGIGYPIVMKIVSPQIIHKSDIGGVRKNLTGKKDVENAFFEITTHARNIMPAATIYGVLIQEMVPPGKEVIIGITKDSQFGHMVMFGLGGIYVEVLRDISFRVVPLSNEDVHEMVREIKTFPLLRGVRGEPETDIEAIERALLAFSGLAADFPQIIEADINPLMAHTRGNGVVAIDARFTIGGE